MRSKSKNRERKYTSARKQAERRTAGFTPAYLKLDGKVTMYKPKSGLAYLDILPYEVGEGNPWASPGSLHYERTFYVHRGIGAGSESFLCPRMNSKKPCPVCEHRAKLMKKNDGSEESEEMIQSLSPKQRQLFNVIDTKNRDKGVQLWDMSYHNFGKRLEEEIRDADEDEEEIENFFFLEGGSTLKVGFGEESGGGYKYLQADTIKFKPRADDYGDDILAEALCLDDLLKEPSYEDLKKEFLQTAKKDDDADEEEDEEEDEENEEEDEEDEENEKSSKKSSRSSKTQSKSSKRSSKDDEDEEEDGEDEEEEDEEDDEPPVKKKKKASRTDEDLDKDEEDEEEEDEDEEEDEEEEEAPPKGKSSKGSSDKEKSSKSASKKSGKDEDDDEWEDFDEPDEDEDEEEEDEEDDEPPVKKKKRS